MAAFHPKWNRLAAQSQPRRFDVARESDGGSIFVARLQLQERLEIFCHCSSIFVEVRIVVKIYQVRRNVPVSGVTLRRGVDRNLETE